MIETNSVRARLPPSRLTRRGRTVSARSGIARYFDIAGLSSSDAHAADHDRNIEAGPRLPHVRHAGRALVERFNQVLELSRVAGERKNFAGRGFHGVPAAGARAI